MKLKFFVAFAIVFLLVGCVNADQQIVASQVGTATQIWSLTTYDDGTGEAVYGGTYGTGTYGGNLLKWNTTLGGWTVVATQLNSQNYIRSLAVYNDGTGNAIFGGTGHISSGARLYKYNTTLGGWLQVAPQLYDTYLESLATYDDGTGNGTELYGGTAYGSGWLFKYNNVSNNWTPIRNYAGYSQSGITALLVHNDGTGNALFAGTSGTAQLHKNNASGSTYVARGTWMGASTIHALAEYNDGTGNAIYGSTGTTGKLWKHNLTMAVPPTTEGWVQVAEGISTDVLSLTTFNDGNSTSIFGGTYPNAYLLRYANWTYDATNDAPGWQYAGYDPGGNSYILSLVNHDDGGSIGDSIFGGTRVGGELVQFYDLPYVTASNVSFTQTAYVGVVPFDVTFNDTTEGDPDSFYWDYWDGWTDNTKNTTHTYTTSGNYTVEHTAYNALGGGAAPNSYVLAYDAITPSFTPDSFGGPAPWTITFTDTSTGTPDTWAWDFGEGNVSAAQHPSFLYNTPGVYNVTLNASNPYSFGIAFQNNITITIPAAPVANFTSTPNNGTASLFVQFNDTSTGSVTSYAWDFGDGGSDNIANPNHTFVSPGVYLVTLTVSNLGGSSSHSELISVIEPTPVPTPSVRQWAATHNVKITVRSVWGGPVSGVTVNATYVETSGPLAWLWDWVGLPANATVQNTTLSGHTGADGSINFLLVESVQYNITAFKAGEVNAGMFIYPKDDDYTIWADGINKSILFPTGYNELEQITFNVSARELNTTAGRITVNYGDALGQTTWAQVLVNQSASTGNLTLENTVASYTSGAGNFTYNFDLLGTRDESYIVRLRSSGTVFANVTRDYGVAFPPGPVSFGIPEGLLVYLGMLGIIVITFFFPRSLPGPAVIVAMMFAWVFYYLGWWKDLAPPDIVFAALVLFSSIAIIFNIVLRSKKTFFE